MTAYSDAYPSYAPSNLQPAPAANKPLWAAVGVLGLAVVGMGSAMIYQMRPAAPATPTAFAQPASQWASAQQLPAPVPVAPSSLVSSQLAPDGYRSGKTMTASAASGDWNAGADDLIEKPVVTPAKPARHHVHPAPAPARKVVSKPVHRESQGRSYAGASSGGGAYAAPAPLPVRQVCSTCGSVESVTPVTRSTKAPGPGVGAVAGGVLGAVLGNQVGHGNGRAVATILGAVGGGYAGNAIEGNVRKQTVYEVGVRMEDGSRRTVEVAQPPSVGNRITVEGQSIRSRDGAVYQQAPSMPAPRAIQTSQPIYDQNY